MGGRFNTLISLSIVGFLDYTDQITAIPCQDNEKKSFLIMICH